MPSDELAPALRSLAERYEIVSEIGHGGMTTVFLARERATGRTVAIKTIDARHADDAEARARFAREARTVASLDHLNIVRTLSVERLAEGVAAIVMEYAPGATLREALASEGPFSFERTERILRDVAEALRYAHTLGLVHRDVKPENVFLDAGTGRALISDFGIARAIEEENRLTLTGTSIGTPTYMSPEQIDGKELDGRTDIYSLGLVGWEMLAGARPWDGESLYRVIYKQKHEDLPRLSLLRPDIPEHLLFTIEGALQKDRETRWANLDEFLEELSGGEPAPASAPAVAAPIATGPDVTRPDAAAVNHPIADAAPLEGRPATPEPVEPVASDGAGWDVVERTPGDDEPPSGRAEPEAGDGWPVISVPGTPDDAALDDAALDGVWRDDEARGHAPRSSGSTWLDAPPDQAPFRARRLVVPLALAVVAAVAIAGGLRSRPSSPRVPLDTVTRATSTGELDRGAARAPDSGLPAVASSAGPPAPDSSTTASRTPATGPAPRSRTPTGRASAVRTPPPRRPATTNRRRADTHQDSLARCSSPAMGDQQACLGATLADRDYGLNNVYRTLIGEMRRQARVPVGAPDPPAVERLRSEQRRWLVTRDETCRREASASADGLWAVPRVRCLGREGIARAAVLADRLTRLRAP